MKRAEPAAAAGALLSVLADTSAADPTLPPSAGHAYAR
jgi:hypothetical protein